MYLDEFRGVATALGAVDDDVVIAWQTKWKICVLVSGRFDQRRGRWRRLQEITTGRPGSAAAAAAAGCSLNVGPGPSDGRRWRHGRQRPWIRTLYVLLPDVEFHNVIWYLECLPRRWAGRLGSSGPSLWLASRSWVPAGWGTRAVGIRYGPICIGSWRSPSVRTGPSPDAKSFRAGNTFRRKCSPPSCCCYFHPAVAGWWSVNCPSRPLALPDLLISKRKKSLFLFTEQNRRNNNNNTWADWAAVVLGSYWVVAFRFGAVSQLAQNHSGLM